MANFSSNITSGCSPILVQFTDQSTGNPTSWNWDLGNGTISTIQNPSTTYITPGTYTVTLTVSDANGSNTKTVTNYITAVPTPIVSFVASDSGIACPPQTIQFTDQSTMGIAGAATYLWDFGDGFTSNQANPVHTYTNTGNFSVTLSVTNNAGCSKLITKTNYIQLVPQPVAGLSATNTASCTAPFTVNFNNTSANATSYAWDFGDGGTSTAATPSHTYSAPGTYTVRLIASNVGNCQDTLIMPTYINISGVTASFTSSATSTCLNSNVSFTSTSTPAGGTSTWFFGDGGTATGSTASHAYAATGTYTVKQIYSKNGCLDSTTKTVVVGASPVSQFSASQTTGCSVPFTTQFNNTSTGAVSYLWIFGDGNTSTAVSPTHTYNNFGTYTVKLVSYSGNGCADTSIMTGLINVSQATMSIGTTTSQNGCAPATINFITYLSSAFPVSSYTWNFGDGTIIPGGSTMTHTYTNPGYYLVTVNFTTAPGCSFTSAATSMNIGLPPTAGFSFSPTAPCPSQNVTFTNTSNVAPGTTYTWYFGDGSSSTQPNPTYAYSSDGPYTITLVANSNGCLDSFQLPITVSPPKAQFSQTYSCTNRKEISLTNTSTGGSSYLWDFGDGNTSTLQNPGTYTYANFGSYNVILTVTNQPSGCTSTHTIPVVLFDLDAQFTTSDSTVCKGESVNFVAQSAPNIAEYQWNFGQGPSVIYTGANSNSVSRSYLTPGTYTVRLVVKDIRGCYDTLTKPGHIVVSSPIVSFTGTPLSGCSPLTVNFTDASTATSGITGRLWRFGDGNTNSANVATPSNTYSTGVYSVTLKVTDANGCSDSITKTNYISAIKPVANFSTPDTNKFPGHPVTFINISTGTGVTYS